MTADAPRPDRHVGCHLVFEIGEGGASLVLQVAPPHPADVTLQVVAGDEALEVQAVDLGDGARHHVVRAPAGELTIDLEGRVAASPPVTAAPIAPLDPEAVVYLRPSRFCPSDVLQPFADAELGHLPRGRDRAAAVADWVFERVAYDLDATSPIGGAAETLLSRRGVCRDFAHLTVALCRAVEVPARFTAVYAPGLSPMDFHAVAEVLVDGAWEVLDATRLAPRGSLVRIATGRDAADTAFATSLEGHADLVAVEVHAVVDGDLPGDDHVRPMRLF